MRQRKTIFCIKFIIFLCLIFISQFVSADAKVDGFFRESLVKGGFFENNPEINKNKETVEKETFFISREERRLNPQKAPSNSIKLPDHSIRMRTRSIGQPGLWGAPVYTESELLSQ
jgi:hypothetical protein